MDDIPVVYPPLHEYSNPVISSLKVNMAFTGVTWTNRIGPTDD